MSSIVVVEISENFGQLCTRKLITFWNYPLTEINEVWLLCWYYMFQFWKQNLYSYLLHLKTLTCTGREFWFRIRCSNSGRRWEMGISNRYSQLSQSVARWNLSCLGFRIWDIFIFFIVLNDLLQFLSIFYHQDL